MHSLHRPSEPLAGDHQDTHIDLEAIAVSTLDEVAEPADAKPTAPVSMPARASRRPPIVVKRNHQATADAAGAAGTGAAAPASDQARETVRPPDQLDQGGGDSFDLAAGGRTLLAVHTAAREALDDARRTTIAAPAFVRHDEGANDEEGHDDRYDHMDQAHKAPAFAATIADTLTVTGADALGATEPVPQAAAGAPVFHVSPGLAQALRVYDVFPSMPDAMRAAGIATAVSVEICVTDSGNVSEVTLDDEAAPALRDVLRSAIRTWRYRPLVLAGNATPFCHDMQVRYSVN